MAFAIYGAISFFSLSPPVWVAWLVLLPGGRLALLLTLGLAWRLAPMRFGLFWVVASRSAPFHYIFSIKYGLGRRSVRKTRPYPLIGSL